MTDTSTTTPYSGMYDDGFDEYLERINQRFASFERAGTPMFHTNIEGLFATYLVSFSRADRQYHNCHACLHFFERYGDLVVVREDGTLTSVFWEPQDAPPAYRQAVTQLRLRVEGGHIRRVFLSGLNVLGTAVSGEQGWTHFHVRQERPYVWRGKNASQEAAEKQEDFYTLQRALRRYTLQNLQLAIQVLNTQALYRSEKVLGAAQWLCDLQSRLTAEPLALRRENILWAAVAQAPPGYCHPSTNMIGTLLEDVAAGYAFEEIARRFAVKMSPLQYQRPQAAPSAGNVRRGEELVAELGLERSLERRFARLEDIQTIWKPAPKKTPAQSGVFGHLRTKNAATATPALVASGGALTAVKFLRDVLPHAERMEALAPARGPYCAFVTATHPDAPPILQWDREGRRNPVSWYVYSNGSRSSDWNLRSGEYFPVTAVAEFPPHWYGEMHSHHAPGLLFALEGCRDQGEPGAGLFPELLRTELREVRATLEAYSKNARLTGAEEASACGLAVRQQHNTEELVRVRVITGGVTTTYTLDRWE